MAAAAKRHYLAYGLRIAADLELSLRQITAAGEPDVTLTAGTSGSTPPIAPGTPERADVIADCAPDGQRFYLAMRSSTGYRIWFRDVAVFEIAPSLRHVTWRTSAEDHRAELVPVVFEGTVLALLLLLRKQLVLHASAVRLDDAALAFVGQSGRGKSTMAAWMAGVGAQLISDDVLAVDVGSAEGARCLGSASSLRLRDAARPLADLPNQASRTSETPDARLAMFPAAVADGWTPLGGVIIPTPSRRAKELEVTQLSTSDALVRLASFPRLYGITSPEIARPQFEQLAHLVRTVPVAEVVVPWGPPFGPEVPVRLAELHRSWTSG